MVGHSTVRKLVIEELKAALKDIETSDNKDINKTLYCNIKGECKYCKFRFPGNLRCEHTKLDDPVVYYYEEGQYGI